MEGEENISFNHGELYRPTFAELAVLAEYGYIDSVTLAKAQAMGRKLPSLLKMRSPLLFDEEWVKWSDPSNGHLLLHVAVEQGDTATVEWILAFPPYLSQLNVVLPHFQGGTALGRAMVNRNLKMMRTLIKWGAWAPPCKSKHSPCPFFWSWSQHTMDCGILFLKRESEMQKKRGLVFAPYAHLDQCCYHADANSKYVYMKNCLERMHQRLRNAASAFVVFIALTKRMCNQPDVWRHLLQPMLRDLWDQYCVFPMWDLLPK